MRGGLVCLVGALASCGSHGSSAPASRPPTVTADTPPPPTAGPLATRASTPVKLRTPVAFPDGARFEIEEIVVEQIAANPSDPGAYPAGTGVTVTMSARGHRGTASLLSKGYTSAPVAWLAGYRIELVRADPELAHVVIDQVSDRVIATQPLRIQRGETVKVHDAFDFTFDGHSHKSISAGMESPLIVHVSYQGQSQAHSLVPPRETSWRWQDMRFTLGSYEYGDRMELVVDRFALVPVALEPLAP